MRTIIDIPNEQVQQLAEICRKEEVSRAEAIRRAIALFLREHKHTGEAFGIWKGRGIEGVDYQHALRDEWKE